MRIRMNEQRERRLELLMEATGGKTKAGAIDIAVAHYRGSRLIRPHPGRDTY